MTTEMDWFFGEHTANSNRLAWLLRGNKLPNRPKGNALSIR
jgi:hypothetical protein